MKKNNDWRLESHIVNKAESSSAEKKKSLTRSIKYLTTQIGLLPFTFIRKGRFFPKSLKLIIKHGLY